LGNPLLNPKISGFAQYGLGFGFGQTQLKPTHVHS